MDMAADTTIRLPAADRTLDEVRHMVQACIQCGTCTASCPNEFAMDLTPRQVWRLALMGQTEAILGSKTFSLCSACYLCTLRCPRGLPLTEAMGRLKQLAAPRRLDHLRSADLFYANFLESVRRHGRVREMEFMTLYFTHMMDPRLPLRFASLGLRLMGKGKVSLQFPSRGSGRLTKIFAKVREMETEDRP